MTQREWIRAVPGAVVGFVIGAAFSLLSIEHVGPPVVIGIVSGAIGGWSAALAAGRRGILPAYVALTYGLWLGLFVVDDALVAPGMVLCWLPATFSYAATAGVRSSQRRRSTGEQTPAPDSEPSQGEGARRVRERLPATVIPLALVALPVVAFVGPAIADQAARLACGGRECVRDAGISLALPDGWHSQPRDYDEILFAAAPSHDSSYGIMVRDATADLDGATPADLDEVDRLVRERLGTSGGFTRRGRPTSDRVSLPVCEALRIRYVETTSFILSYSSGITEYWCFVNGRLVELTYVEGYGEGQASLPAATPSREVQGILDSLQIIPGPAPDVARSESAQSGERTDDQAPGFYIAEIDTPSGTIVLDTRFAYVRRTDGWHRNELDPSGEYCAYLLTRWGAGAAVIGSDSPALDPDGEAPPPRYVIWTSDDGLSWHGPSQVLLDDGFIVRAMTTWDSQLVLVGERLDERDRYWGQVWASTDARTWRRARTPSAFDGVWVADSHPGGDGLVVVIRWRADGACHETHWTSSDLIAWRLLGPPGACAEPG